MCRYLGIQLDDAEFTEWYDADFDLKVVDVVVIERQLAVLAKRWSRAPRKRKAACPQPSGGAYPSKAYYGVRRSIL